MEERSKAVETFVPGAFETVDPLLHLSEGLGLKVVDALPAVALGDHDARVGQHPKVLGYVRLVCVELLDDVADWEGTGSEEFDDVEAIGLAQCPERGRLHPGNIRRWTYVCQGMRLGLVDSWRRPTPRRSTSRCATVRLRVVRRPFRFSIQTGPFDDPRALREYARKVEDLGYAELFSSDHITGGGLNTVDPFLPLMVAAEATSTLRFGPLVLNNEFYNPVLLARTAASFDLLSEGRLVLGLGTGYAQSEHDAADIELRAPRDRVTRFGESLSALRSLLDDGSANCDGEHITIDVDGLGVRPAQDRVPLLVGGHGKRLVSVAARMADIFQFTGLTHDPVTGKASASGFARDDIAERRDWLRQAAGDRFDRLELSTLVQQTCVGSGAEEARRDAAARMNSDPTLVDETPFAFIGSESQVIEKLVALREDLGIHHVVSRDPDDFAPIVAALAGR